MPSMSNPLAATISNVSAPNVYHLTLFICHLFGDGPFRTIHILQDSDNLPIDIHSNCFEHILLYVTDVRRFSSTPWNDLDSINNVLQIISFESEYLAEEFYLFFDYLVLYRIFIFSSIDAINTMDKTPLFQTPLDSRTLVLHFNETSVSVFISESNGCISPELQPIFTVNHDTNFNNVNLFDRTFGEYERMESIEIHRMGSFQRSNELSLVSVGTYLDDYFRNYYHLQLNRSFINMTWDHEFNTSIPSISHLLILNKRAFFKEATIDYEIIKDEAL